MVWANFTPPLPQKKTKENQDNFNAMSIITQTNECKIKKNSNQKIKEYNDIYVGVVPAHSNHQLPGPKNMLVYYMLSTHSIILSS